MIKIKRKTLGLCPKPRKLLKKFDQNFIRLKFLSNFFQKVRGGLGAGPPRFYLLIFLLSACMYNVAPVGSGPELIDSVEIVALEADSVVVARGDLEQIEVRHGVVRVESYALSFEAAGYLAAIYVFPGDEVYEGQVLARLEWEELAEELARQEELVGFIGQRDALAEEIFAMQLGQKLLEYEMVLREAAADFDADAMEAAELILLEIERDEMLHRQAMQFYSLDYEYARRSVDSLREAIDSTVLLAPESGTVTYRVHSRPGTWLAVGEPLLFVNYLADLFVEYTGNSLPAALELAERMEARINGQTYDMRHIPMSDEEVLYRRHHRLPMRWRFEILSEEMPPLGAYASMLFYTVYVPDVLRVPVNAIVSEEDLGNYVYQVINGGHVIRPVRIGVRTDSYAMVLDGLAEGDEILVR